MTRSYNDMVCNISSTSFLNKTQVAVIKNELSHKVNNKPQWLTSYAIPHHARMPEVNKSDYD